MLDCYNSNYEIGRIFGVSEGVVRKWIKKALNKEIHLQMTEVNNKQRILKNQHNWLILNEQAEKAKKNKPIESRQKITVNDDLYQVLDHQKLVALINALEVHKTIPHKFTYLEKGADLWEKFYKRSLQDNTYPIAYSDLYFFENQYRLIKDTVHTDRKINVVDIGGGNGEPAIPLLRQLQQDNLLNSYTAVDISSNMLEYSKQHLKEAGIRASTHFCMADYESQSLESILYQTKYNGGVRMPTILLALGGSLFTNHHITQVFQHITEGMCPEDILIVSNAIESSKTVANFATFTMPEASEQDMRIPKMLNLSSQLVENELLFNEKNGYREHNLVLKENIDLNFGKLNHTIRFNKYDKINIWTHKKDNSKTINQLAESLNMQAKVIIRHPSSDNVTYILSR